MNEVICPGVRGEGLTPEEDNSRKMNIKETHQKHKKELERQSETNQVPSITML